MSAVTRPRELPRGRAPAWETVVGVVGVAGVVVGHYLGLFVAPPERMMGDVGRILYAHVPVAWYAMVTFTVTFVAGLGYLVSGRRGFDWLVEASCEVGVVLNALLLLQGSLWARPTWGVWWTWDPRLTSATVMLLSFVGVLLLRQATPNPERRATWSGVASVLAYVNIPITYMSVKWWRSLHQIQSTSDTVADPMKWIFLFNLVALGPLVLWMIARRWRLARDRALSEDAPALEQEVRA